MSDKLTKIIEELKTLTLLEASELVTEIENVFGVDTSISAAPVAVAATSGAAGDSAEEKTEFDITLIEVPADKKIAILKIVRTLTGLGLKEAKELVESAPKVIKEAMPKSDAEEAKAQIETAGGKVELK